MNWAVITLSKKSLELALEIKSKIPEIDVYTMPKYMKNGVKPIESGLRTFNKYLFENYNTLVYIMAAGIVVRDISPYLKHKSLDPAVLVLDNNGEFVISLLSGHLGGANEKAKYLAEKIGATPVITTASDTNNKIAVDMIAKKYNLFINNFQKAKEITALIVNDDKVGVISEISFEEELPHNMIVIDSENENVEGIIYISNKEKVIFNKNFIQLIPRNIIIGIGCRKGTEEDNITNFIDENLRKLNITKRAVKKIVSIDIKKLEEGIIKSAEKYGVEFKTYNYKEIKEVENLFKCSEFVKKTTGVGSVCEPTGYLASNKGKCLLLKTAKEGITLSIWETKQNITTEEH